MPQPTTNKKPCDDSCTGPECSHFLCHDGESNGTALLRCEDCGQPFCLAHLTENWLNIFLCADCTADQKESFGEDDSKQLEVYREVEALSEVN